MKFGRLRLLLLLSPVLPRRIRWLLALTRLVNCLVLPTRERIARFLLIDKIGTARIIQVQWFVLIDPFKWIIVVVLLVVFGVLLVVVSVLLPVFDVDRRSASSPHNTNIPKTIDPKFISLIFF